MINGELIVDNFAGGGGASTGIELATGYSVDIAINHDPEAIRMHQTNHPNTKHYCEDVWMVDPVKVCNGRPVGLAWFSPDCKHFSKAKGGKPKDKNIRGLAWVACRWAGLVRPRVIMLENVEEFKGWGPLNRQHHPIKAKRGTTFQKFVHQLNDLGYEVQYRELIAADYGAPTTRKRFFLIARCDGKPIVWPSPTHAPADSPEVKNGHLKPYLGAYTQIDFQRPCPSIFDTAEEIKEKYGIRAQRPLSPKTMERIARGIQKYILENPEPFLVQCNHGGDRKAGDLHIPLPTITAKNGYGIVRPTLAPCKSGKISAFLHKYYSGGYKGAGECMKNPLPTVTAWDHNSIVAATLVQMNNHCDGKDIRNPLPTITAGDGHFGEVRAFLLKFHGNRSEGDLKEPLNVITTKDKFGLVTISGTDYQIVDIGLRMLEPQELYGCQGFPSDYIIDHDYTGKTYQRAEQYKAELDNSVSNVTTDSIFVSVQQKYTESGEYLLTHIIVNDPSNQVKGGLSNDSWGSYREYPTTYAGRTGAAVTTNGSYFSYDSGQPVCAGCFIKDGKISKDGVTNGKEICLDNTGKFYTPSAGISASTLLASGVKDIWGTADPLLIQDGQKVDLANQQKINNTYYNRTAIGMVQPGEYYMITAGTAQYKNGLSFAELQSIFANLGCTYARSMDGGGSSSLVVNGKLLNTPAQYDERPVVDFLSFLP